MKLSIVAAVAIAAGGFAFGASVAVDATQPGAVLPNSSQVLTFWNGVMTGDRSPVAWPKELRRDYPTGFARYAELMACTGGNKSRDLFKNPDDRTVLDDYDFAPLVAACRSILGCGMKPYLKLGNVPAKFSSDYDGGEFSMNIRPPTDDLVHYRYMKACAAALKAAFGRDEVRSWRFAVLTEADNTGWFQAKSKAKADSCAAFFRLYDYAARAFEEELGPNLVFGTHLLYPGDPNCPQSQFGVEDVVAHCVSGTNAATGKIGAPLRLLTASYYGVPDRDDLSQGRCTNLRRIRAALDKARLKDVVTGVDEGRVIIATAGREKRDLVSRAVGASYQAAFDVRVMKEIFDDRMDYFASWGYFSGPRIHFEGIPSHHYFSSRELAKFEGFKRAPTHVSGKMPPKEELDAIAGVSADGRTVRAVVARFRDKLVFTNRLETTVKFQLPKDWAGKRVRASILTLDDRNNWFVDWERDRVGHGVTPKDSDWSWDDFAVLSGKGLRDEKLRAMFAKELQPRYAAKAASVRPVETIKAVSADATLILPVFFVGNGAAFLSVTDAFETNASTVETFDIRDFGARESDLLQTKAIQGAIDAAASAGGGEVVVPEGRFRTGGLVLKSGITLRLADGAELRGDANPDNYPGSKRWYRALIRADGARNVAIVGARHSRLNGVNAYDARGEENFRGPHAIMMIGCTNVTLKGYTIRDSANWAHALFHCANVTVSDVRVFGGHDALDFHDSENVTVERCELRTGDDCIAGFANRHCRVRDCVFDTSCQAVRMGGSDILFERCRLEPTSSFGHRWSVPLELRRAGALAGEYAKHGVHLGVVYYCDTRWKIDRPQRDIVFRDCTFARPRQIFSLTYDGRDMWCCRHPLESIAFEHCTFTDVVLPIAIYGDAERPLDFTMRDCTVTAAPGCGGKPLLSAYNYGTITLANLTLKGFSNPHLVTRSKGKVAVTGATPIENRFRPDENDRVLSFAECAAALAKEPADEAAYRAWDQAHPTPPESRWSEEKGLYVTAEDPLVIDVYGSALAVLRNETPHRKEISRSLCSKYQYLVGWGRTGAVAPCLRQGGELSPLPAGAFGYAMSFDDPLFARTFFTDFVRSARKTPAAVAGARLALERISAAQ